MLEQKKNIVFLDNNLKQREFIDTVLQFKYNICLFGGAIRGGKTFVVIAIFVLLCKIYPKSRWAIIRADNKRLRENTYPVVMKFLEGSSWKINYTKMEFTHPNGSMIKLLGENYAKDKELNAFKGAEYNGFAFEEINECQKQTLHKAQERAGAWMIPGLDKDEQPPPLILGTCNPTQGWVKQMFYTPWKLGQLPKHLYYLPSYMTDNPNLSDTYRESVKLMPPYEYRVFALGDWDIDLKVKNAFWHAIDSERHIKPIEYNKQLPVHISIDSNSMPYCTATVWQIDSERKRVMQIGEVLARPKQTDTDAQDNNHAGGLARLVCAYLDSIDYEDVVFVYGDASTQSQNTIDERKRSFYQIFTEELSSRYKFYNRMTTRNPAIVKSAEFVNALYSGWDDWQLLISENCKESISDYFCVQIGSDGTMAKTRIKVEGVSYEPNGHISDTKRYFINRALEDALNKWDNRFNVREAPQVIDFGFGNI